MSEKKMIMVPKGISKKVFMCLGFQNGNGGNEEKSNNDNNEGKANDDDMDKANNTYDEDRVINDYDVNDIEEVKHGGAIGETPKVRLGLEMVMVVMTVMEVIVKVVTVPVVAPKKMIKQKRFSGIFKKYPLRQQIMGTGMKLMSICMVLLLNFSQTILLN